MTSAQPHPEAPTVRELIVELARTEDALRDRRPRAFTAADRRLVRHQAAVVRQLRRHH